MHCTDTGCEYSRHPDGYYSLFSTNTFESYVCKFTRKLIMAENMDSPLFAYAISTCRPKDLYGTLYDSIVIWNSSIILSSPFERIYLGTNFTMKGNLLYSKEHKFLFQITEPIVEKNITMYKTTDGLY